MSEATPEAPAQDATQGGEVFTFEPVGGLEPPADDAPETEWKAYARKWQSRAQSKADYRNDPKYREALDKAKKLDDLEQANATELEKAQKVAADNAARAQQATVRAVRAEVKALADDFADKEDAVLNLGDLTRFVGDDDEIDEKAIKKALKDVLERKPHLAKPEPKPEPSRPGQRPTESLRPGAAPAEPERASNLFDAVAQAFQH